MTDSLSPHDGNGVVLAKSLINTQETVGRAFYGLAARPTTRLDWKTRSHFLERLTILETALQQGYDYFNAASQTPAQFTTAAEWMLDNYVYIQQALKQVEENLPGSYERQLPRLVEEPYKGQSRIYVLAAEILKDSVVVLDMEHIYQAVERFQTISVLSMGELWALPTMLRVSLLEMLVLAIAAISEQPLERFLEEEMAVQLPASENPELIVARIIPALRLISTTDWKVFFEAVNITHGLLNNDPAGIYPRMDFETRDRYRGVIERLGFGSPMTEEEITLVALSLAENNPGLETYQQHVGYYLVDQGRKQLEKAIGYVPRGSAWLHRLSRSHPALFYMGGILLLTLAFSLLAGVIARAYGFSLAQTAVLWILAVILSSSVAVTTINNLTTQTVPPHILPKLTFEKGIPADARTMVVLPCLLTDQEEIDFLLRQLELHYIGNRDAHLSFALLSDFGDSTQQETEEDKSLLAYAVKNVEKLNQRYASGNPENRPFFLFHRHRLWNASEKRWMGWERKRGKIMEFNRLITGEGETSYTTQVGSTEILPLIRYVITLDADTTMPPGTAHRLVGTLAHPLNQAVLDEKTRKVVRGYGILQPRVQVRPVSASRSWFSRIYTEDTTLDLYTRAVSDVYQDLFKRGIFVGKGIYDVAAFSASLEGRVPENRLLSHDLFESFFARAALVTDILLMEDFPHTYTGYMQRAHRWVRGDWQLLPWLFRGKKQNAPLSLLNRWQMIDNIRRSIQPIALLLLLLAGWLWFPAPAWIWTILALFWTMLPLFSALNLYVWRRINQRSSEREASLLLLSEYRGLLQLIFLPHEALVMMDAIVSVLYRLGVSHEKLLEWTTARDSMRQESAGKKRSFVARYMRIASFFSALVFVLALWKGIGHLAAALPVLVQWVLSDRVAAYLSAPLVVEPEEISEEDRQTLREQACRTWFFFERFVGPEDNWLPPDHFQEVPRGVIAHRTSPTNIGMLFMVYAGVYQLGYVGPIRLITRLTYAHDSMRRMKTFNGHLYNWYDTQSLQPLNPRYVSTVDSGNLAASMLVVEQFLLTLRNQDALRWAQFQALGDTFSVLHTLLVESMDKKKVRPVVDPLGALISVLPALQGNPAQWTTALWMTIPQQWFAIANALMGVIENNLDDFEANDLHDIRLWIERANYQLDQMQKEVDQLLPWARFLVNPPAFLTAPNLPEQVQAAWQSLQATVPAIPRLHNLPRMQRAFQEELGKLIEVLRRLPDPEQPGLQEAQAWCNALNDSLALSMAVSQELQEEVEALRASMDKMFRNMQFGFLFDSMRKTFHIGYNFENARRDDSYYDLMASEARITSFVAIAKGDVPMKHWLHLGRPVTNIDGRRSLLSWSATMFEYLMPTLFMLTPPETLLSQSVMTTIYWQKKYAQRQNVPWGISESGYYSFDSQKNYQYKAFGVPGLGLKRGLGEDLVITPYASLLALPFTPQAVLKNMRQMNAAGLQGPYGYYEALDMTFARTSSQKGRIVQSYMAHHQGMILAALTNTLLDDFFVHLFHADSRVKIFEMLLYEQMPEQLPLDYPHVAELQAAQRTTAPNIELQAWTPWVKNDFPQVHCLSNNQLTVLLDQSGAGFSRWRGRDINRWQADATKNQYGTWVYLYDRDEKELWSLTDQPIQKPANHQEVTFFPHQVKYSRRDGNLVSRMSVMVAPEENVEIRRIRLTNYGNQPRRLVVSSYSEVTLAEQAADHQHPAFSKLFVQANVFPEHSSIEQLRADPPVLVFSRRQRSSNDEPILMSHTVVLRRSVASSIGYQTDREVFLGRNGSIRQPAYFDAPVVSRPPTASLDPICAMQVEVTLEAHTSFEFAFLTVVADNSARLWRTLDRFRMWPNLDTALDRAKAFSERELFELSVEPSEVALFDRLLSTLIYPQPALRASTDILSANTKGQSGLWAYGISGDLPILLYKISDKNQSGLLSDLVRAQAYWRSKQIAVDLVVLNCCDTSYDMQLQQRLLRVLDRLGASSWMNQKGGIFVLRTDLIPVEDQNLLQTAALAVLHDDSRTLEEQLAVLNARRMPQPEFTATLPPYPALPESVEEPAPPSDLQFANGWGGFNQDGSEYVLRLQADDPTPAPWINVIANPRFGFVVSEAGSGCSWAENSGENRLTTWTNDALLDKSGEALYVRDEETGQFWSPTLLPRPAQGVYTVQHGAGYSRFETENLGLKTTVTLFTDPEAPIKFIQLRLESRRKRISRFSAVYYAEWVLGTDREKTQAYIQPTFDTMHNAILAHNPYNDQFPGRTAFLTATRDPSGITTNRHEFLGPLGSLADPEALHRYGLSGEVRPGYDPCAAMQILLWVSPGETKEVTFLLGQGRDDEEALSLIRTYQDYAAIQQAWQRTQEHWDHILNGVQISTPDPAMDVMLNRWLLYQSLSCRMWGRTGLYQSSGAFGFRDQLQDSMAYLHRLPEVTREHLLRASAHQFAEGDVLHWWHPPLSRGVRTRCSDDLLWLPYVTTEYVAATGDEAILDEVRPFLQGPLLQPGEMERYDQYRPGEEQATLFEHCRRALIQGDTRGVHGLPLIGSHDWNDGMNRVGEKGQGESVWMAWFLYDVFLKFAPLCERRGEVDLAQYCRKRAAELKAAVDQEAWDGEWYRRAYFDDGTPLGSAQNAECQIDSIAQSWGIISGAADPHKARLAMKAVEEMLIKEQQGLILLFTPPFNLSHLDPGYIKGYPPGVRENGGQYTHAALWTVWAIAEAGQGRRAAELFRLLNPVLHADSREKAQLYEVEPYVVAADVYGAPPFTGQGGWTWYTGSASWMYRLGIEMIIGLRHTAEGLCFQPAIPPEWDSYQATYRYGETTYAITVENPQHVESGVEEVTLDGEAVEGNCVPWLEDGQEHQVRVRMGQPRGQNHFELE